MQVVEIENDVDTPSGVEVVSEFVEVEGALNETQVEALLGFLRSDSPEESDADLILSISRADSDSVVELFPTLLARFPTIYQHLYTSSLQVRVIEALATILLGFLNRVYDFISNRLFGFARIVEEVHSG